MKTLLGYLAQFSSFTTQGEVLCTQGLTYLLQDPQARAVMASFIAEQSGTARRDDLTWHAEAFQTADWGRPDLEARAPDDRPYVKIEGKLGAGLSTAQLRSYADDLRSRTGTGILVALVPRQRLAEAAEVMQLAFGASTPCLSSPGDYPRSVALVISWEQVLDELEAHTSGLLRHEVAGLREMYHVVRGLYIEPLAGVEDLIRWREREDDFVRLVDEATRRLTVEHDLLPFGTELEEEPIDLERSGYRRRYVCRHLGDEWTCFSIGVCDPFEHHVTPIWMRFHHNTPRFALVRDRLLGSQLADKVVSSGSHVWLPLDVPLGVDGEMMVAQLIKQAELAIALAYEMLD